VQAEAADQDWARQVLQSSSSNQLDRLRLPQSAPVASTTTDTGKGKPAIIDVAPITAAAQTQGFIVDAMKREIVAIADPLRQQAESVEISYNDQQVLQARNRFSGAVFEVRLPNDSYRDLRFQLLRQNPTPSLATLGGTRLLTEVHAGSQVMTGAGADGSTFVEAVKVTYTTEKNWTFGAGVLTSQQIGGDPRQGLSARIGHNYWGVANVQLTPDGEFHFRGLDTQAPREAWNWFKGGSTGRMIAVGGGVLAGAAYAVYELGKGSKEMVFSNPLPELKLGTSKFRVIGGVLGKVSLGGSDDGSFKIDGKLTGGTLRFRQNGQGGVANEQGVRYRRERMDDGNLQEVLQGQVSGTNKLGGGYLHHNLLVGYDLQTKHLGESSASAQVVMPFGSSRQLSWNAGGGIGMDAKRKLSFGDLRAGVLWQPSSAITVFGSAGYMKGQHLIDPNFSGGLIGSMMPRAKRGEVPAPNPSLGAAGTDKGRMAFSIGTYIRL
jgi:hypothetical protein